MGLVVLATLKWDFIHDSFTSNPSLQAGAIEIQRLVRALALTSIKAKMF